MYIKVDEAMNQDAGITHWLRHTLPNDEVREQEEESHATLVQLGEALMSAHRELSPLGTMSRPVAVIQAIWCSLRYNYALKRYVAKFHPLISVQKAQVF